MTRPNEKLNVFAINQITKQLTQTHAYLFNSILSCSQKTMSSILFCIIIVAILALTVSSIHLSPVQMQDVRSLLGNPALTSTQRGSLQNLLYVTHEKWAIKKAMEFKELHRFKCRDITTRELALSSKIGLLKSSRIYDGRSHFVRFSEIFVKSELLRTMSSRLSVTSCISMKDRLKSKQPTQSKSTEYTNMHTNTNNKYRAMSSMEWVPSPMETFQTTELYEAPWTYVDSLDAFTKHVVWLKYDSEFQIQRSNKQIAELMCCSEEMVRKAINRFSDGMKQGVLCSYIFVKPGKL